MILSLDTIVLLVGAFSAIGFSLGFSIPTLVAAAEVLRGKHLVEFLKDGSAKATPFPKRVVHHLATKWPRFFYIIAFLFFVSGLLDLLFVAAELFFPGSNTMFLLDFALVLVIIALIAMAAGWAWILTSCAFYTPAEVEEVAKEAQRVAFATEVAEEATVKEYVQTKPPAQARSRGSGPARPKSR